MRDCIAPLDDSDTDEAGEPVGPAAVAPPSTTLIRFQTSLSYVVSFEETDAAPSLSVVRSSSNLRVGGEALPRALWRKVERLVQERTTQVQ